jgi:hypothetical protein
MYHGCDCKSNFMVEKLEARQKLIMMFRAKEDFFHLGVKALIRNPNKEIKKEKKK